MTIGSINLVIIKRVTTDFPYVLEDTVHAVKSLLERGGIKAFISYNNIDPTIINIVFGIGAPLTVPISEFRRVASPSNTIIFNVEQIASTSSYITDEYVDLLSKYVTLDYSCENIKALRILDGNRGVGFEFPIVPSPSFQSDYEKGAEKYNIQFDFAFYGAKVARRLPIFAELEAANLRIKYISGFFGRLLAPEILDCRAVLNLHAYESALFEAGRCLRPLAMGIPVLSEVSVLPDVVDWRESGVLFLEGQFSQQAATAIKNSDLLQETARAGIRFTSDLKWPELAVSVLDKACQMLH